MQMQCRQSPPPTLTRAEVLHAVTKALSRLDQQIRLLTRANVNAMRQELGSGSGASDL
jgi:hypothetical protein